MIASLKNCDKWPLPAKLVHAARHIALPRDRALVSHGEKWMLRPDQFYALLTIMRGGSLVLALVFAGKILAYAAGLRHL